MVSDSLGLGNILARFPNDIVDSTAWIPVPQLFLINSGNPFSQSLGCLPSAPLCASFGGYTYAWLMYQCHCVSRGKVKLIRNSIPCFGKGAATLFQRSSVSELLTERSQQACPVLNT